MNQFNNASHWQVIERLDDLDETIKRKVFSHASSPFNCFEFLNALEASTCVCDKTGWTPHHFLYQNENEYGLLICYKKSHSYGEYVFDWSWANAYHQHNISYYPKLLCAIPFTPVPCAKWLTNTTITEQQAVEIITVFTKSSNNSGIHYLYPEVRWSEPRHIIERQGHQFHWFNDNNGELYKTFDDFLSVLQARKRKMINKERNKITSLNITSYWKAASQVSDEELTCFYQCYQSTYHKRGQVGYLSYLFFDLIIRAMPNNIMFLFCRREDVLIASALYFLDKTTLYGRYWGALEQHDTLHFEACYYKGIELAIERKLTTFNPGTQGEHKIARGFQPTGTWSYHSISHPAFHQAIKQFCNEEMKVNQNYMANCQLKLPFHRCKK